MGIVLEEGVAAITFKKNEAGTVDIAGICPEQFAPGDIVHDIFVALAPVIAEVVQQANKLTQEELKAEGHDVDKIMSEVQDPNKR